MEILRTASAGEFAKNDVKITVSPAADGRIHIDISSIVLTQYGDQIENAIREVMARLQVQSAVVMVEDKGALDFVIKARTEAALLRASKEIEA